MFTGAGIFVFTGSGETGAQPNNGLVISRNPVIGQRFRFFCRSNSLTRHVGELIGLDESPVTAGSTFEFPTPRNGGELGVENIVGTHSLLPASEQGVYTCRIPLEGGEMREINIGVYPSGFSSELLKLFESFRMCSEVTLQILPIMKFGICRGGVEKKWPPHKSMRCTKSYI